MSASGTRPSIHQPTVFFVKVRGEFFADTLGAGCHGLAWTIGQFQQGCQFELCVLGIESSTSEDRLQCFGIGLSGLNRISNHSVTWVFDRFEHRCSLPFAMRTEDPYCMDRTRIQPDPIDTRVTNQFHKCFDGRVC